MKITDFKNSDFWKLLGPPLIQFSKLNNFLWVCWFLGKNVSNFVPPIWKLNNPYCHTVYGPMYLYIHFIYFCFIIQFIGLCSEEVKPYVSYINGFVILLTSHYKHIDFDVSQFIPWKWITIELYDSNSAPYSCITHFFYECLCWSTLYQDPKRRF